MGVKDGVMCFSPEELRGVFCLRFLPQQNPGVAPGDDQTFVKDWISWVCL